MHMSDSDAESEAKLTQFFNLLMKSCLDFAVALKFDKDNPPQVYAICTYCSIVEIAAAIDVLVVANQTTCVPVLLRTLLDGYASFGCCITDPNHFKSMYASFAKEKLRILRSVDSNPDNPYLKELSSSVDIKEKIAEVDKELSELKANGASPMNSIEEFKKAGLLSEYQSLYWQLCLHAHNNISMLERRHLAKKENGDLEVTLFKETNPRDLVRYLDTACGLVVDATRTLHELLKSELGPKIEALYKQLEEIRSHYPKESEGGGS
jgi:hypothetical protein